MKKIPINIPLIDNKEKEEVLKVLDSGILTSKSGNGPFVKKFQNEFSKFVNCKYAIATNSGTAALHSCLLALDLKPGDEIILPSFTFVATASVVLHVNAKPVFIDIDLETYTINPELIKDKITDRTKVIIPVHLFGHPADKKPIIEIAEKYNLFVIEDACQAHGAKYDGKMVGSIGDAACFSFYPSKNMTTGEGGMITTNNEEFAEKLKKEIEKRG